MKGNQDLEAYRPDHLRDGSESPGRNGSEREVASKVRSPGGRACNCKAKAEWEAEDWMRRLTTPAGWLATAWRQGHTEQLEKPSSSRGEIPGAG
jgi:hypothetical protein